MEWLGNLGYIAIVTEATKGVVAATPNVYYPIYEESLSTNANFQMQQPIAGSKFATYDVLPGQRDHQGDFTVPAEPNSTAHFIDMLLTLQSTSGSGPYTRVYGYSKTANPKSKTIDISTGNVVRRYWGVEASKIAPVWDSNEKRHKVTVSARGSFQGRSIASIATTTVTFDTKYDPNPTKGLVVGDLVRVYKASTGATLDTTIATITNGTTVILGASAAAFAAGDVLNLRPATVSAFNTLPNFLWSSTEFCFGSTYTLALAATHSPVEVGSSFELVHEFEDDAGAKRSGSKDPASLPRKMGKASFNIKRFFDTPEDVQRFNDMTKTAAAIRHYSGASNQYEYRVGFNAITTDSPVANIKSDEINYSNIEFIPSTNQTDGIALSVTVINGLATL